jgi:nitrite reductase (NADH) large subunit
MKLVVIGAGKASGRKLETLFEAGFQGHVTLFDSEPRGTDNQLMLSPVLSGEKTYKEIVTHDEDWYAKKGVVSKVGETPYGALAIATGSAPFIIPVARKELPGVVTYRDLEDTNAMIAASRPGARPW